MTEFLENILDNWVQFKPYWKAMQECPQSPCWHSEGNVAIHTEMVLDEFYKIVESGEHDLTNEEIQTISFALLFHDVAKPIVLTHEEGLWRSHKHTQVGAKVAWELLEYLDMDIEQRLQIKNLVHWHGKPPFVMEKDTEKQHSMTIEMSMDCDMKLLYYVVLCDQRGRICDDQEQQIEKVEYFKMVVDELGVWNKSFPFKSNIAKFNYLVKRTHHYSDEPFDDTRSKVYLMCGIPGSGKSTIARGLADSMCSAHMSESLPIICLDEIRKELKIKPTDEQGKVIQEAKRTAKRYLANNVDFIWDATNITRQMRQGLIQLFTSYNAYTTIVFIDTPFEICAERNKKREAAVPEKVMLKMRQKLEVPMNTESHEIRFI